MHKLAQSVLGYVRKNDVLHPGDRVGIAVSGGADSVALLRLMLELRDELGLVLSVVHLNHTLRGKESDADQEFVRELGQKHDLEFTAESRDAKLYASERKLSLEAASRELRYEFFSGLLCSGINRIATAHTLDDQAETVLLKLTRGAGTRGLAGIYPEKAVSTQQLALSRQVFSSGPSAPSNNEIHGQTAPSIVRPVLGTRRVALREYLAEIGQAWREDASNRDLRHTRNRIRHEILPRLERDVNPSLSEVLAETAEIARAEEEYWSAEILRLLADAWQRIDPNNGILQRKKLTAFSLATQRRLVRAAAESLGLSLEFEHVEGVLSLDREAGCAPLPDTWTATLQGDQLRFQRCAKQAGDYEYRLPVPGRVAIAEAGMEIEALVACKKNEAQKYGGEHIVSEQFTRLGLLVRNWRPGERFWPAHTRGPKKIKELLQDKHVTGEEKRLWPVVVSGDEIIWMRGFGVRRDFQANEDGGILIREAAGYRTPHAARTSIS
ncbi:MAG TPA: tRNA lysidine(34) synthetase TilS [Terriglobales bacterium]|nr:tRNA lysidine(34) synthetase TilS [Terriglobales bacterium]